MYSITRPEIKKVFFSGHSLGGGASTMAGLRFLEITRKFPELYKPYWVLPMANPISTSEEFIEYVGEDRDRFLNVAMHKDPVICGLNYIISRSKDKKCY